MSGLEPYIRERLKDRKILLMSHLVLGFPSLKENAEVIDAMVEGGVDVMELQIPFSEPSADGPVIARANQAALDGGFKVREGLAFIRETVEKHPIPFLIMTYYNILYAYGIEAFMKEAADAGVRGLIVPDLPLELAGEAMAQARACGLDWIQIMPPTSLDDRLNEIGAAASGFVYCAARKGVTGKNTDFGDEVGIFLDRCRAATSKPLAVGFGVKTRADVDYLVERGAEVAVVGTAAITVQQNQGAEAVGRFFADLRSM